MLTMTMFFPFQELDRLTGGLFQGLTGMPVDLHRERDRYVLDADLPGVDPGSVDVSVDGQVLTIRAERRVPAAEGVQWITRERPNATFVRQFSVGEGIDADGVTATYDNGVLSLTIPVTEQAKPRRIQVAPTQKSVESGQSKSGDAPEQEATQVPDAQHVSA
jgi:HSP20 family protein